MFIDLYSFGVFITKCGRNQGSCLVTVFLETNAKGINSVKNYLFKNRKVVEHMGIDDCLILLFDYLIVVVISCVLNLNDWYKRGNYSVGGSVLVLVGGVLCLAVVIYMLYTFK